MPSQIDSDKRAPTAQNRHMCEDMTIDAQNAIYFGMDKGQWLEDVVTFQIGKRVLGMS